MSFDKFLNQAWNDHAMQAEEVYQRLDSGIQLIENDKQIPSLAQLITHVCGEHLGKWSDGVTILQRLKAVPFFEEKSESEHSIFRSIATLELASGKNISLDSFSNSDRVGVLAVAASALAGQDNSHKAVELFKLALDQAQLGINKDDPANRALAVTGNNLACSLKEKSVRSQVETELMILAAETARKYWEIAGGWLEIGRAEYRLAMTHLCAENLRQALEHAQKCLEINQKNSALPIEHFFGYEVLARVEKARANDVGFVKALSLMKSYFEQLVPSARSWCEKAMNEMNAMQ